MAGIEDAGIFLNTQNKKIWNDYSLHDLRELGCPKKKRRDQSQMNSRQRRTEARTKKQIQHYIATLKERRALAYAGNCLQSLQQFVQVELALNKSTFTDRCSYYYLGRHSREFHIFYESENSSRDQKLRAGESAGGACPICRFKYINPPVVYDYVMKHMVFPLLCAYKFPTQIPTFQLDFMKRSLYVIVTKFVVPSHLEWNTYHRLEEYIKKDKTGKVLDAGYGNLYQEELELTFQTLRQQDLTNLDAEDQRKLHLEVPVKKTWTDPVKVYY